MVIEAGERNQPQLLHSRVRKLPISLGHQLHSSFQKPKGDMSRGLCILSQHLPHSHSSQEQC